MRINIPKTNKTMKNLLFFTALAAILLAGGYSYGQELEPKRGSNGKYGFVDKTGKEVIPFKYEWAVFFSEGLASVKFDGKYGFIDKTGREVVPFKYDLTLPFSEGLAYVKLNGKYGLIDKSGKEIIPCKYDNILPFSEDLAVVKFNGKHGFIDKTGKEVIPCKYDNVLPFSEDLAAVKFNGKCGFIDKTDRVVISFKYDDIYPFSEGLARVHLNGKCGFIDKTGREVVAINYRSPSDANEQREIYKKSLFSYFAKNYVEQKVNEWQQKGEFEKTAEWQQRVTESARKAKAAELLKEAERAYIAERTKGLPFGDMTLGAYDADNEVYLIQNSKYGNLLVPIPYSEAQAFKASWNSLSKTPTYFIENDELALAEITFKTDNKTYKYSNQASLSYAVAQIDYKFDPIDINVTPSTAVAPKGNQDISTVNRSIGKSDVAVNIPTTGAKNDKTFAVIIANENYQEAGVSQVEFAINDGTVFKEYCIKTLGLPEQNISYRANATLNNMRAEVNWLRQVAEKFKGEAKIIFYYAGHGIPDEKSQTSYLLPVDGYGSDARSGYKLDDLYQELGSVPAKSITVFMDACFSGAQRSGEMLASARGVVVKAKPSAPVGNMVVFSAAQGDETAYPYREKGHGLFTYFLLKKLQETKGNVTLGELNSYLTTNVGQQSVVVNRKSQTPTVTPSRTLEFAWEEWKLR